MRTSAGSTDGSEPGASRPGPAAGVSHGALLAWPPAAAGALGPAGTSRKIVTAGTGAPPGPPSRGGGRPPGPLPPRPGLNRDRHAPDPPSIPPRPPLASGRL